MRDEYKSEQKGYRIDDHRSSDRDSYDPEGRVHHNTVGEKDPWTKIFCPEKSCEVTESSDLP